MAAERRVFSDSGLVLYNVNTVQSSSCCRAKTTNCNLAKERSLIFYVLSQFFSNEVQIFQTKGMKIWPMEIDDL